MPSLRELRPCSSKLKVLSEQAQGAVHSQRHSWWKLSRLWFTSGNFHQNKRPQCEANPYHRSTILAPPPIYFTSLQGQQVAYRPLVDPYHRSAASPKDFSVLVLEEEAQVLLRELPKRRVRAVDGRIEDQLLLLLRLNRKESDIT